MHTCLFKNAKFSWALGDFWNDNLIYDMGLSVLSVRTVTYQNTIPVSIYVPYFHAFALLLPWSFLNEVLLQAVCSLNVNFTNFLDTVQLARFQ